MKTAVSIPDDVFDQAERAANELKVSRSELFTRALRAYLGHRRDDAVTASYDEAFADDCGEETALRREVARRRLLAIEWDEG